MWCYLSMLNKQKNNNNLLGMLIISFSCFKAWWMKLILSLLYTAILQVHGGVCVYDLFRTFFSPTHPETGKPTIKWAFWQIPAIGKIVADCWVLFPCQEIPTQTLTNRSQQAFNYTFWTQETLQITTSYMQRLYKSEAFSYCWDVNNTKHLYLKYWKPSVIIYVVIILFYNYICQFPKNLS